MALDKSKQIAGTLSLGIILTSSILPVPYSTATVSVGEPYISIISHTTVHDSVVNSGIAAGSLNGDDNSDDALWNEIDALFGVWANRDDINDDWLDSLRGRSGSRMTEIYGDDWE